MWQPGFKCTDEPKKTNLTSVFAKKDKDVLFRETFQFLGWFGNFVESVRFDMTWDGYFIILAWCSMGL